MPKRETVLIAGANGLVGRAIVKRLEAEPDFHVVAPARSDLDFEARDDVRKYFTDVQPKVLVLSAALVGGIAANVQRPVDFLVRNLNIQNNAMLEAASAGAHTIVFLGSSCIYPKEAPQPMREDAFMGGSLEPTNESYAVAKIAGIRLARALALQYGIRVVLPMPSNVYGPGDHFDLAKSHVLSALVKRFVDAHANGLDSVQLWGTGVARREFLHSRDLADAVHFLLRYPEDLGLVNVGTGSDISIADLAELVASLVGFGGNITWDASKPDGMVRKLLNVERLRRAGWFASTPLEEGIRELIGEYRSLPSGATRSPL